jgi:hypothetical protein
LVTRIEGVLVAVEPNTFTHFHLVWVNCVGAISLYKIPLEHASKFIEASDSPNDIDLLLHYNSEVQCEQINIKCPVTLFGTVMFVSG